MCFICRIRLTSYSYADVFHRNAMDGNLILHMDDRFASESLNIANSLKRKKLLIQVELLKKKQIRAVKGKTMDQLDEYVMVLEAHRIKVRLLVYNSFLMIMTSCRLFCLDTAGGETEVCI